MNKTEYKCLNCGSELKSKSRFSAIYKCEKCNKEYALYFNSKGYIVFFVLLFVLTLLANLIVDTLNITSYQFWFKFGMEALVIIILDLTGLWDKAYKKYGLYEMKEYNKKS